MPRKTLFSTVVALGAAAAATVLLHAAGITSAAIVALTYLLVVLFVASAAPLPVAVMASVAAMLAFNYFFLPPVGTFNIVDPVNWVALGAFLIVAVVASQLSASARRRAEDALQRRVEVAQLFDLSRDILLTTDNEGIMDAVAKHVARRFDLPLATVCVPDERGGWRYHHGGRQDCTIDEGQLDRALAEARGTLEFDADTRSYGGHRAVPLPETPNVVLIPIRLGTRAIGLLAIGGRHVDAGTADAIAGLVAIAVERTTFFAERRAAELSRQRAELSSALLASLSHDLRTPLTAIRVAIGNVRDPNLSEQERQEQAALATTEVRRLDRVFQDILDMTRIEARALAPDRQWVTPGEILDAAVAHLGDGLASHRIDADVDAGHEADVDPRLTAAALSHLLDNATRYSPAGTTIAVRGYTDNQGLHFTVTDQGPGLDPEELAHLFEPSFRGRDAARRTPGTGMGLAITRGLLAVESGRVWGENAAAGGARFAISIPAQSRATAGEATDE